MAGVRWPSVEKERWGTFKGDILLLDLTGQRCWFCSIKRLKSDGLSLNNWWPTRAFFPTFLITDVPWRLRQLQITSSSQTNVRGSSGLSSRQPRASCPQSQLRVSPWGWKGASVPVSSLVGSVLRALFLSVLSHSSETKRLRSHPRLCKVLTNPSHPLQPSRPTGCVNVIRPAFPASAEELHDHIYCCCYSKGWMTFFSPCGWALPVHLSPLPPSLQG